MLDSPELFTLDNVIEGKLPILDEHKVIHE